MQQTLFSNQNFALLNGNKVDQQSTKNKKSGPLPWIEKYRPNKIDDVSFQEDVVQSLQGVLKNGNLPNTLLYGPPGTGKTSTILALSKQLFGPNFYHNRILELNASDDRGIEVVRGKIKKFAQKMVAKNTDSNYLCPNYKIIILDEADSMTHDAQSALRRMMEDTSSNTRFCIICNYVTKIIEPLTSRCVSYRFKPISLEAQLNKLQNICQQENLKYDVEALKKLIEISEGDLRKSTNTLQSAYFLNGDKINQESIFEISGMVPIEFIQQLFDKLMEGNLQNLTQKIDDVLFEGYSADQINSQFFELLMKNKRISQIKKSRMLEKIALADKALNEGSKDDLTLYNMFAQCLYIQTHPDI